MTGLTHSQSRCLESTMMNYITTLDILLFFLQANLGYKFPANCQIVLFFTLHRVPQPLK